MYKRQDPGSVLNAYKTLLALRRAHPVFAYGAFAQQYASRRDLFCYRCV